MTEKEQTFNPAYFNRNKIDFSQYDILEWNVIELVWGDNEEISEGWYDPQLAKEKIDKSSPAFNYRFKKVPSPDLINKVNLLSTNAPKAYIKPISKVTIKTILKASNNALIATIIGGLIVLIFGTWLMIKIGLIPEIGVFKKWR